MPYDDVVRVLDEAVTQRAFPCACVEVGTSRGPVFAHASGRLTYDPDAAPAGATTIFDLASLTKVIFTTTTILRLAEQGRLHLDDPLAKAIPDLRQYDVANAPERRLTYRQCLAHRTHLPAVEPLYTYGQDPQTLRAFILQREWRQGPPVYSDNNFLLLGIAIERLTGQPLADQPLPPGFTFRPTPADCAATEFCTWRNRMIRGEVHDENAFAMGGAAGHAGLFGPAAALLGFARALMQGELLSPATLALLQTPIHSIQGTPRTLGWQLAAPGWPGGDCPPGTLGHTGFTGTGLWITPTRHRAWTLLTNRVHPSRHTDSGIAALRQTVGTLLNAA